MKKVNKMKNSHETGINIGGQLKQVEFTDCLNKNLKLIKEKQYAMFFISNYCVHCIDLLPELSKIKKDFDNIEILLFSTADNDDNQEILKYFEFDFSIINLSEMEMEKFFKVTILPFCLISTSNTIVKKGVIYNKNDFNFLISK